VFGPGTGQHSRFHASTSFAAERRNTRFRAIGLRGCFRIFRGVIRTEDQSARAGHFARRFGFLYRLLPYREAFTKVRQRVRLPAGIANDLSWPH
jgi:hypothetical protein